MSDEPIRDAWEFAERLWADQRVRQWVPGVDVDVEEAFSPELLAAIRIAVDENNGVFSTISKGKANHVTEVTPTGFYVVTDASVGKGNPAQLVPAWMIELAWEYLQSHGRLTNKYLVADDGMNVKRSSFVCALLATLPGIVGRFEPGEGIVLTTSAS